MKCVTTFAELFKYFKISEFNYVYIPKKNVKKKKDKKCTAHPP